MLNLVVVSLVVFSLSRTSKDFLSFSRLAAFARAQDFFLRSAFILALSSFSPARFFAFSPAILSNFFFAFSMIFLATFSRARVAAFALLTFSWVTLVRRSTALAAAALTRAFSSLALAFFSLRIALAFALRA